MGSDSSSACARSDWNVSLSSAFELTLPNCSTRRSGCASATRSTVAFDGSIRSAASWSSPVISKSTNAECWSADTGAPPVRGDRTRMTSSVRLSPATASRIVAVNCGSDTLSLLLWMSTCSSFGLSPES